jgi:prefoldin subunit 5
MDRTAQNVYLSAEYAEAIRYMDNANDTLQKARKDGKHYIDRKYVRTACGTAYNGVLIALDAWFALKELPKLSKKQRKSIEYYMKSIATIDKKMVAYLGTAYHILHLDGYYDGETSVKAIEVGFDAAYEIIEKIKPEQFVEVKETKGQGLKRVLNNLLISAAVMFR